jgi:CheY-like chemotaxis protein
MAKPAAVAVPSLSILLVEDNRDAGETLEQLLQLEGHRTRLALDGKAATEVFLEQAPEVLISDVGLPDVSGYELLRRLRQLEGGARVFAIALTGYAQPDDVERAKEAGFDAHLPKPAPLERLDELLATAALRRATGAGERSPPSP